MYRDEYQRNFARQLRNQSTGAERRLWQLLRAGQLGYKFRRQAAIGPYIVDFICFTARLVIELDGPQHQVEQADHDARRTAWLSSLGYGVLRFRNHEVDEDIHAIAAKIAAALAESAPNAPHPPSPTLPSKGREPEDTER